MAAAAAAAAARRGRVLSAAPLNPRSPFPLPPFSPTQPPPPGPLPRAFPPLDTPPGRASPAPPLESAAGGFVYGLVCGLLGRAGAGASIWERGRGGAWAAGGGGACG